MDVLVYCKYLTFIYSGVLGRSPAGLEAFPSTCIYSDTCIHPDILYISIIYIPNLAFEIAVPGREGSRAALEGAAREHGGASREQGEALREQGKH